MPDRPTVFAPDRAPDFVELKLDAYRGADGKAWWTSRPKITPRLQLVHTNGASKEGSIESAINWGNANPALNTHPHYQVDRHRAAKLVPTDRKGIGNKTAPSHRGEHGDVSDWSLVIETADEGYPTPGENSGFIGEQVEMIAQILAYESIVHPEILLAYPAQWWEAGTATHTDPFEYPYYTIAKGKVCPGRTKKQQMRTLVLPRACEIRAEWLEEDDMPAPVAMRPKGFENVFIVVGADVIHADPILFETYGFKPADVKNFDHPITLKGFMAKAGVDPSDLVKSKT